MGRPRLHLFRSEFRTRVLELNASDERGIAVIRDKVKVFARLAVSAIIRATVTNLPSSQKGFVIRSTEADPSQSRVPLADARITPSRTLAPMDVRRVRRSRLSFSTRPIR